MRKGKIISSSSLGYGVCLEDGSVIQAKRRKGKDIKDGLPMIGDDVILDSSDQVERYLPRRTVLERPRVANLEVAAVVIAARQPDFSDFLLDKYLSACAFSSVPALIVVTKWDLADKAWREKLSQRLSWYEKLGYTVCRIGAGEDSDLDLLRSKIRGKTTAFIGQTGVGKSSLANRLDPSFNRPVGRYDQTMGRGTHQTKEVVIFPFLDGFLADTPGFSDFRLSLNPENLAVDFPGFGDLYDQCRFKGCLHNHIKDCAVEKAVAEGRLSPDSYQNYLKLLDEAAENSRKEKKSSHSSRQKGSDR